MPCRAVPCSAVHRIDRQTKDGRGGRALAIYCLIPPTSLPYISILQPPGILHANNARDIEMDAKTGTLTIARTCRAFLYPPPHEN